MPKRRLSDTCLVCGQRIDICDKNGTCPIARELRWRNKYHYLNELAMIRNYLREITVDHIIPQPICDLFNSVAKKLGATETVDWAMSETHGSQKDRLKALDDRIAQLIDEYYLLVSPTQTEIEEFQALLWDDVKSEADVLGDPQATIGKYNLAIEAQWMRENEKENDNEKPTT